MPLEAQDEFDQLLAHVEAVYSNMFSPEAALAHLAAVEDRLVRQETLRNLASSHSKEQFRELVEWDHQLTNAIGSLVDKQGEIATYGIDNLRVRNGLKEVLLNDCNLYETLRRHTDAQRR